MKKDFYDKYRDEDRFAPEIKSDFHLILSLIKELFLFILLFIPYLIAGIFYLFTENKHRSKYYFSKIFSEPFVLIRKIKNWFFQAKYTAILILFLFFIFFIELLFLSPYINNLMVHPNHFLEGNYYSIITSIFLHADIIHILTNCLALLIFGRIVERQFGYKIIWLFLISGVIANLISNGISLLLGDLYYSLGASGAIAGLIIFAIMIEPFAFTSVFIIPLPIFIVGWFLIGLDIIGVTNPSNVNHFAHLGGYSALLFMFFFLEFKHRDKIIAGFMLNIAILVLFFFIWKISGVNISGLNLLK